MGRVSSVVLGDGSRTVLGEGAGCCPWGECWVLCLGRVLGAVLGEDRGAVLGMGLCLGEWGYA